MNITPTLTDGMRQATRVDWRTLARISAEAFHEDPVMNWTFGGNASIPAVFDHLARDVYLPRGQCYLLEGQGATMWLGPGQSKEVPMLSMASLALKIFGRAGAKALARTLALDKTMIAGKPKTPHMYLFSIGVVSAGRGKGLGGRLMQPMLEACTREGLPVYLENSNPANHGFYSGLGFEVMGGSIAPDDAPPLIPMWRAGG